MADPVVNQSAAGSAASGSAGQATGNDIANVIAQGVAAAVTASLQEVTNKLNEITQALSNQSTTLDTTVQGVDDPYENKRRDRLAYDGMQALLASMATMTLENANLILKQQLRHADISHSRYWGDAPSGAAAGKVA